MRQSASAMKSFASLLMALILLHSACMGRCLAQETTKQPPCHQQEENSQPDFNLCSEGPSLEAKSSPVKCTMDVGVVPSTAAVLTHFPVSAMEPPDYPELISPSLSRLTVLRI